VTDTGKQIASQNSVKHQLTGKGNPALPGEEDAVEEHVQGYFQTYAPVGLPEQDLVRNLAENNWRLQRCHALERIFQIKLETLEGDAFDETLRELRRTSLYAHRIQRAIEKSRAELRLMQSERKAAYAKARQEAILLTLLADAKGQSPDVSKEFPSPELCGGFVYSMPEIVAAIARIARLEEAKARFAAVA
jgi:hypothetical protein